MPHSGGIAGERHFGALRLYTPGLRVEQAESQLEQVRAVLDLDKSADESIALLGARRAELGLARQALKDAEILGGLSVGDVVVVEGIPKQAGPVEVVKRP